VSSLPKWILTHAHQRDLRDVHEFRGVSVREKWLRFLQASAWSWALLAANPNRERALARRDPPNEEARLLWRRLMERQRAP
jgi:hypothetical protein